MARNELVTPLGDSAMDETNDAIKTVLSTLLAGEDQTNNVIRVEGQFSGVMAAADTQVKSTPGFVHTLTFSQSDAAPTAGTITLYDNTAKSGTKLFEWNLTTAVFIPFTVTLDMVAATGLYLGFATTADVNVSVSYR